MPASETRRISRPSGRTCIENIVRSIAGRAVKAASAQDAHPQNLMRKPEQMLSTADLSQRFDEVYTYEKFPFRSDRALRRQDEDVRRWLTDPSEFPPLIAWDNLATWAIPHLLHIVATENRRRALNFHQGGSFATTLSESFFEGADAYGAHREERSLAGLLEQRIPPEERLEAKLVQSIAEEARIEERMANPDRRTHTPLPPVVKAWIDQHDIQKQRRKLGAELARIDEKIHFLREEIGQKNRREEQRKSEIDAYTRALDQSFIRARREAKDQLSELPAMKPIVRTSRQYTADLRKKTLY